MMAEMPLARLVGACLLLLVAAGVAQAQLRVQPFVTGLSMPLAIVPDPRDSTVHFVVQQGGRIRVVKNGILQTNDFLNITSAVLCCDEQGLFSLVFPPDAATNDRFWVNFTRKPDGATVVARFLRSGDPLAADPTSRVDLVWPDDQAFIDQPFPNHNGGHMAFGSDGFLYIGLGDGGSGNDPGHRAQDPDTLLGKILRIDVNVPDANPKGYAVPSSNPFVDNVPVDALTEIWAFGVRNPWRFSFDDVARGGTGALVMGDVGQNAWEEINYEPAGQGGRNYGWRNREGKHPTPGVPTNRGPAYTPLTDPIFEYSHNGGSASITGGYVYRGSALGPEFVGRYFFADFVLGRQWSLALTVNPTTHEATASDLREHTAEFGAVGSVGAFGVDADGELFVLDYGGTIYRILPQDPPNLRVTAVSAPATGVAGRTISVTNRIKNVGGVTAAGSFEVGIYLSPGDGTPGAGMRIGSRTVTSLAGGGAESAALTAVTVPAGTVPGSYFVSAVVDDGGINRAGIVDESNEDDNGLTAATKVDIIRPDLAMLSVSGPSRGAVGQPISVTTSVKNIGPRAAGAFTIGIYLSSTNTPGSVTRIATRSVASLAPGATTTAATSANIPQGTAAGTYVLSAVADDGQVVLETGDADDGTNDANNAAVAAAPLQVVSLLPDLEIASVAGPATMGLGRPMTVPFTVRNSGLTVAGPFRVRFYLAPASPPPNPGAGVDVGFRAFTSLAAGASLATTAVVTVPGNLSQTSYFVSAVADADGQVTEIVEGTTANGRVAAAPTTLVRPDLIVSRLDGAGTATARAARGGTLTLRNVTVKNAAAAPGYAPASTLKFYLSDDAALGGGDVELTPAVPVPALAPGASFAAIPTLTIPASVVTGARVLIARANALSNVPESDATNDTASAPVEIGDFADLKITAVAGPAAAGTGRPMTVSFTTRNAGTAPVGLFRVTLFMAAGPNPPPVLDDGTDVGSKDFTGLAAGASLASTLIVNGRRASRRAPTSCPPSRMLATPSRKPAATTGPRTTAASRSSRSPSYDPTSS